MITAFTAAVAVAYVFMPFIKQRLERYGVLRKNYLGEIIPCGMGIGFLPPVIVGSIILMLNKDTDRQSLVSIALGIAAMTCAGTVDDFLCDGSVKGFKGHIGHLLRGRLTTGGFKALIAGAVSLGIFTVIFPGPLEGLLNCLLFMLFTNFFNLLDLRPGRAIKFFFFTWVISFCIVSFNGYLNILCPLAGGIVAYLPYEMKRKSMMGDAGANGIGAGVGLYYCFGLNSLPKAAIVTVLILLHIISERHSFTEFIYNNRILRVIDNFGNKGSGEI